MLFWTVAIRPQPWYDVTITNTMQVSFKQHTSWLAVSCFMSTLRLFGSLPVPYSLVKMPNDSQSYVDYPYGNLVDRYNWE